MKRLSLNRILIIVTINDIGHVYLFNLNGHGLHKNNDVMINKKS